jgi:hypothetical protein
MWCFIFNPFGSHLYSKIMPINFCSIFAFLPFSLMPWEKKSKLTHISCHAELERLPHISFVTTVINFIIVAPSLLLLTALNSSTVLIFVLFLQIYEVINPIRCSSYLNMKYCIESLLFGCLCTLFSFSLSLKDSPWLWLLIILLLGALHLLFAWHQSNNLVRGFNMFIFKLWSTLLAAPSNYVRYGCYCCSSFADCV